MYLGFFQRAPGGADETCEVSRLVPAKPFRDIGACGLSRSTQLPLKPQVLSEGVGIRAPMHVGSKVIGELPDEQVFISSGCHDRNNGKIQSRGSKGRLRLGAVTANEDLRRRFFVTLRILRSGPGDQ